MALPIELLQRLQQLHGIVEDASIRSKQIIAMHPVSEGGYHLCPIGSLNLSDDPSEVLRVIVRIMEEDENNWMFNSVQISSRRKVLDKITDNSNKENLKETIVMLEQEIPLYHDRKQKFKQLFQEFCLQLDIPLGMDTLFSAHQLGLVETETLVEHQLDFVLTEQAFEQEPAQAAEQVNPQEPKQAHD